MVAGRARPMAPISTQKMASGLGSTTRALPPLGSVEADSALAHPGVSWRRRGGLRPSLGAFGAGAIPTAPIAKPSPELDFRSASPG